MDPESYDDAAQRHRNDDGLKQESDEGCDVEVGRALYGRLPGNRRAQHQRVNGENVDQRGQPVLIELHETYQHERTSKQMRNIECEPVHQKLPETKRRSVASSAN